MEARQARRVAAVAEVKHSARGQQQVNEIDSDDECSSEETLVQLLADRSAIDVSGVSAPDAVITARRQAAPMAWPAALNWKDALAYSALSPKLLRASERDGAIRFLKIGPNGSKIACRHDLDRLLAKFFAPVATDVEADFDFV